ncbi:hypothetical protein AA0Y32_01350 [Georgenia phoenicis]|uniref:hypothetical protein n=1 Tax=unclassified Georgenia TaxID=2626815 RepID=UPI0039B0B174
MSQQVLSSPHAVGTAVTAVARVIGSPGPAAFDRLHEVNWPVHDPESLRGVALLAESRLSAEQPERLLADHQRLFLGGPGRPPVAPLAAPDLVAPDLAGLLARVAVTGPPDLTAALRAWAALLELPPGREDQAARHALVHDHLLTWGARCLSRVQLGAQSFCFQGVATLGLGLLRYAAAQQ